MLLWQQFQDSIEVIKLQIITWAVFHFLCKLEIRLYIPYLSKTKVVYFILFTYISYGITSRGTNIMPQINYVPHTFLNHNLVPVDYPS